MKFGPSDETMERRGQCAVRRDFPEPGKEAAVIEQLFNARITVGRMDDDAGYSEGYDYETLAGALAALLAWDPDEEPEPLGWVRHIPSFRRRPGGDASKEHVTP